MHEALPRRDATHLKRGSIRLPKRTKVALPALPLASAPLAATSFGYGVAAASSLMMMPSGTTPVST